MSKRKKTIRVLIADDFPVTRAGIRAILDEAPAMEVVGEAKDGFEAEQMVAELQPDVLLLDLVMPGLKPYEIEKWVRVNYPATTTLVLTAHDRDCFLSKAIEAGVAGYLDKSESLEGLVQAIHRAVQGEVLITGEQLARAIQWQQEVDKRWERLTDRERQVLKLMTLCMSNKNIASQLHISFKTVEFHVSNILRKLGVTSRQEAVLWTQQIHLSDIL
jgi:NarL family two-component system response regulator LiaR